MPPGLERFGAEPLAEKRLLLQSRWPPTELKVVNLGYLVFFSLMRNACVNLKSILILGTVVETVINRQSKAHESGTKVLFLSHH